MTIVFIVILIFIVVGTIIWIKVREKLERKYKKMEGEINRVKANNTLLKDWLEVRQKGLNLSSWLIRNDISNVVLYGYGIIGKAFLAEMKESSVDVKAIVDKNYNSIIADIPAVGLDSIPETDAIIVSAINYYDEIEHELLGRCKCPIISIEDLVYGVGYRFDEE